jgi:hypothetical protein
MRVSLHTETSFGIDDHAWQQPGLRQLSSLVNMIATAKRLLFLDASKFRPPVLGCLFKILEALARLADIHG